MVTSPSVAQPQITGPHVDPGIELCLLGRFSLRCAGHDIKLNNRKTQAILACLALQDNGEMARERLVGLIWSESDEDKARASLRQALHELKEALASVGYGGLSADRVTIRLNPASVSSDILDALQAARRHDVHPALLAQAQPLDELLGSLETVDPAFQSWISAKRKTFEKQIVALLERALGHAGIENRRREALARALVNLDPTNEIAVRNLMTARLAMGDTAGAMQTYKHLWDLLDTEFDTEPARPTQELFARIKSADAVGAQADIAPGLLQADADVTEPAQAPAMTNGLLRPDTAPTQRAHVTPQAAARLLISVAAIDVGGIRPEHHYLIEGFRRDLLSCLVRFREWLVRDGTSVAADPVGYQEYVVETGAYQSDGAIRLVLMLRDRHSGIYLWTERLNLTTDTWFETQQVIVRRLAAVLNVHISNGRLEALAQAPDIDTLAYDMWLKAQSVVQSWDAARWQAGINLLTELTHQHPRFAPAFSNLAQLLNGRHFVLIGCGRTAEVVGQATQLATEAVRLDPVDSRGHLALGWAHAMAGRHDRAAIHHEMACELNDNDPWTLLSAGLGAASRREHELANELCHKAFDLSITPGAGHWLYRGQIAFLAGDYEGCLAVDTSAWLGVRYASVWKIAALALLGRKDEAAAAMTEYIERLRGVWAGPRPISRDEVAHWLLQLFPYSDEADWGKLREALASTGANVGTAGFVTSLS